MLAHRHLAAGAAVAALPALLALAAGRPAQAATVTYTLDQSNVDAVLPDGTDYLTVTIDDGVAGRVRFTVTPLPVVASRAGANFGLQAFAFNVVGNPPLQDAAGSNAQWLLPAGWSAQVVPPANPFGPFGRFDVALQSGGSSRTAPLVFQLIGTGLGAASFLEASSASAGQQRVFFAAHLAGFDAGGGTTSAYFGGSDRYAPPAAAPLPPAGLLLPAGLLAVGAWRHWARRRRAACSD